jgi:hypothetical protein
VTCSYEAQEPLISATVLSGEAAIASRNKKHNTKQRSLTQEELDMEDVANRRVEEALKTQMALPPSQRATITKVVETRQLSNLEPSPELDLIDDLLTRRSLIPARPPVRVEQQQQQPRPVRSTPPAPVAAKVAPVAAAPVAEVAAVKKVSAVPLRPIAAAHVTPPPVATPPPVKAAVRSAPAPPVAAVVAAPVAAAPSPPKNQLQPADLELMAKSLQMLVKHRGGGPFGAGRLQSPKDISEMEVSLMKTVDMLTKLDGVTPAAAVDPPVRAVPVRAVPAPAVVAPKAVVREAAPVAKVVPAPAAPVKAADPAPAARVAQVQAPVQSETEGEARAPMTIAQGLDQFLSAPQLRSYEVCRHYFFVYQEAYSLPLLYLPISLDTVTGRS